MEALPHGLHVLSRGWIHGKPIDPVIDNDIPVAMEAQESFQNLDERTEHKLAATAGFPRYGKTVTNMPGANKLGAYRQEAVEVISPSGPLFWADGW
jgi:hypothetical protein